jgi:hypothetical protein
MATSRRKPSTAKPKRWTVLVYLAGDNDLDSAGAIDLDEMKRVGSTDDVNVVAQFDRSGRKARTIRYYLRKGTTRAQDVVQSLGETNTGDPAVLANFLNWGMRAYPAEHYLVALWNHGSGWDDSNIFAGDYFSGAAPPVVHKGVIVAGRRAKHRAVRLSVARAAVRRSRRALFRTTLERATTTRGIAFDDEAQDFLDNGEVKRVLASVAKRTGRRIDIVGFDACLMSMAEVMYQMRQCADYSVASQQTEPADGWPYHTVLRALAARPTMTPAELAGTIVDKYLASYRSNDNVTLSACDLSKLPALSRAVGRLGGALRRSLASNAGMAAILAARQKVREYESPYDEYVDLVDLAGLLEAHGAPGAVKSACVAVRRAVDASVVANGSKGPEVTHSHGLSIYFPKRRYCRLYSGLDFAKANAWRAFIEAYLLAVNARPD